ncbi:MAG TPA: nucleotidyltransferase family protein [Solirubrobacteraceae bacterium]
MITPHKQIRELCIRPTNTLRHTMALLDRTGVGIALITDDDQRLLSTVTDGDIRRALLAGRGLDDPMVKFDLSTSLIAGPDQPVTAPEGTPPDRLLEMMYSASVRHIPVVTSDGRVVDLYTLSELAGTQCRHVDAVVMAGGFGSRLRPLTERLPKPMLQVGDRPLLQHILERLERSGIRRVHVTTHYQADAITEYFGDGSRLGLQIEYVQEKEPLGTLGALGLLPEQDTPLLVVNGDVLTDVDFDAMLSYHEDSGVEMTVGVRQFEMAVPYGVVDIVANRVRALEEKPIYHLFVNAGIYLVEPAILRRIEPGRRLDATELIGQLLTEGRPVASFPIHEYWLDVGRHDDYERANRDWTRRQCEATSGH